MLYRVPGITEVEVSVIARINTTRKQLRHSLATPRRWTGFLGRITRARAIRASNSIEGINVSVEDAMAAVDGEYPAAADRDTWRAVDGYRQAMDFILQRCRDDNFHFSLDLILAIHFMITQHDLHANPGNLRPGWVGVHNTESGEMVHEGVDRDLLELLLKEYVVFLNDKSNTQIMIKAAMAHLNIAILHPFSDGNGRIARCIQTAVMANEGIVAPEFSSIEEYTGKNVNDYYDVLTKVGGGGWHPERDARPWIRFCLTAHYRQALTLIRRSQEFELVANDIQHLLTRHGFLERFSSALIEAAFGCRVRNSSYRTAADISMNLASRDLKTMVDAGLLERHGERRGAHYRPSPEIQKIREKYRLKKPIPDPFDPKDDPDRNSLIEAEDS